MRRAIRISIVLGALAGTLAVPAPARASFHLIKISEVFLGTGTLGQANEDAQYIELKMYQPDQNLVNGKKIVFYAANGFEIHSATFNHNVAETAAQSPILAATSEAQLLFDVTADFLFEPQDIRAGGKVCFQSGATKIDCVSWGAYSGSADGSGPVFSGEEGIPLGAAIGRRLDRGTPGSLDAADDTESSRSDFAFVDPLPDGGGTPDPIQVIEFGTSPYSVSEGAAVLIDMDRTGSTAGTKVVTFSAVDGTAGASDYNTAGNASPFPQVQFNGGETEKKVSVTSDEDVIFEGIETVKLRIRNPTAGAVLGSTLNATLRIQDDDADNVAPKSRVTRPSHGASYKRAKLLGIRGTATDAPGKLKRVRVALRRTMKSGGCRWWNGKLWVARSCTKKLFLIAPGLETWTHKLPVLLKKSVGTNVKHYTVYSKATDDAGNSETTFKVGRNANRFEVT